MAAVPTLDPLAELTRRIEEARQLPEPIPYRPAHDPLSRLRSTMAGSTDDDTSAATVSSATNEMVRGGDGLAATIGREVLAMVESRPLGPAARAEAVRRVVIALQNPHRDNVRAVLAVLLANSEDA